MGIILDNIIVNQTYISSGFENTHVLNKYLLNSIALPFKNNSRKSRSFKDTHVPINMKTMAKCTIYKKTQIKIKIQVSPTKSD